MLLYKILSIPLKVTVFISIAKPNIGSPNYHPQSYPHESDYLMIHYLRYAFIALCLTTATNVTAQTGPVFESKITHSENGADLPRTSGEYDLYVRDMGEEYLIFSEEFQEYAKKTVVVVLDLDGDGWDEAVVSASTGGNCCSDAFFIVSKRAEKFFTLQTHEVLHSWEPIEIVDVGGTPTLQVHGISDGVGNTSQEERLSLLQFRNGELVVLSSVENNALISANIEVNSFELDGSGKSLSFSSLPNETDLEADVTLPFDADGDQVVDKLQCQYWERWGAVMCDVVSSKYGLVKSHSGCDRIGTLSSSTNGMKDLVCNRFRILRFNGNTYEG